MEITYLLLCLIVILLLIIIALQYTRSNRDYTSDLHHLKSSIMVRGNHLEHKMNVEFKNNREDISRVATNNQEVLGDRLNTFSHYQGSLMQGFQKQMNDFMETNSNQFLQLSKSLSSNLRETRLELSTRFEAIQQDNNKQLEKMRATVDEKLHKTLEERLGKSFELVSQHLESVQKGLGEMQQLANGVGDLKRVLSNVKTRGVMGEIQLGNILDQLLTSEQYGLNVATIPDSRNHVEFAVKFPGRDKDNPFIWLPIDSKFPMDKYDYLLQAYDENNLEEIANKKKELTKTVKTMAKDICDKYIEPPYTTDFGIMFLPVEGLYAEVVRIPGLMEDLQRNYKIMIAGPANLAAFLNSLQMGFKSLAIEKRSSEVWNVLGAVKTEFGKFGQVLDKVQTKLRQASKTIDDAGVRTRAIERNLRKVEELPVHTKKSYLDDGLDLEDFQLMKVEPNA